MPFKDVIRLRLLELKDEYDSGILPRVVYEELCRKAVADGGDDPLIVAGDATILTKRRRLGKAAKLLSADANIPRIMCPIMDCGKESKDTRGLSSHLLAHHRQSIESFILDPAGNGNYVPKPEGWTAPISVGSEHSSVRNNTHVPNQQSAIITKDASLPEEYSISISAPSSSCSSSNSNYVECSSEEMAMSVTEAQRILGSFGEQPAESLEEFKVIMNDETRMQNCIDDVCGQCDPEPVEVEVKIDKRKFNRGQSKRKSYDKHLKLQCIAMRDDGKSTEEIMAVLGISKGHIEKWYSPKNRERTLERATMAFQTSSKTIQAIRDAAEAASNRASHHAHPAYPSMISSVNVGLNNGYSSHINPIDMGGVAEASVSVSSALPYLPLPLPGMNAMSMVGALSNYTASLSSNTTLLRDGQTLSSAIPSGLSVSAGTILGLTKKVRKKDRKKKTVDVNNGSMFAQKKTKRPVVSTISSTGRSKMSVSRLMLRGEGTTSDSDDEDGVMELLGESRTRKPVSFTFNSSSSSTSMSAILSQNLSKQQNVT